MDDELAAVRRLRASQFKLAQVTAEKDGTRMAEFKVASYNVWFEEPDTFDVRMQHIAELCRNATVVGFQEVTVASEKHLVTALSSFGFDSKVAKQHTDAPYYCMLASKQRLHDVRTVCFEESIMGRGLLLAHLEWPGKGDVVVGVSHLESFIGHEHDVRPVRERQAISAQAILTKEKEASGAVCAIFIGDMNWDDESQATMPLRSDWLDAWVVAGRDRATKFTYDGRANPMLRNSIRKRLDRCLTTWPHIANFELLGTSTIAGHSLVRKQRCVQMAPSDHFGIQTTLSHVATAKDKRSALDSFFAPARSKLKRCTYRGAELPDNYRLVDNELLVASLGGGDLPKEKPLAAFDFDNTLAVLDWSRPIYWKHVYAHAPAVLRELARSYAIAVLSNESVDHLKQAASIEKRLRYKCTRINQWVAEFGRPLLVCVALSKRATDFHKSVGAGMWRFACAELSVPQNSPSFFVGDSEHDEHMAACANVPYHHVDDFFTKLHPKSDAPQS